MDEERLEKVLQNWGDMRRMQIFMEPAGSSCLKDEEMIPLLDRFAAGERNVPHPHFKECKRCSREFLLITSFILEEQEGKLAELPQGYTERLLESLKRAVSRV